jgi:hypothetical protein
MVEAVSEFTPPLNVMFVKFAAAGVVPPMIGGDASALARSVDCNADHTGGADALPVPVWLRNSLVVLVLPESAAMVLAADA